MRLAVALACAAMPVAPMGRNFHQPAFIVQSLLYSFSIRAVALGAIRQRHAALDFRHVAWMSAGFLSLTTLTLARVRANGTSWAGLWNGIIGTPIRFSKAIQNVHPAPLALSALSISAGLLLLWSIDRGLESIAWYRRWLGLSLIVLTLFRPEAAIWLTPGILWIFFGNHPARTCPSSPYSQYWR